ncbi:MAG: lipid A export permease/ATP-binding protein MsbA [bacterium]
MSAPVDDFRLYRRLLAYVLPYKWVFLAAIGGMLLVSAGDASIAVMLRPIIDQGFVDRDADFIKWVPLVLVALGLARALGNFVDSYCMDWVARRVIQDLRQLMFERLLRAPVGYYDEHSSGMLTARLIYNVEQVAGASTAAVRVVFRDAFKTLFLLLWMFYLSWKLSLLFAIILPVAYVVFKFSSRRFRSISLRVQESVGGITHIAKEALQGQRVIKIFGAYEYQRKLFGVANNRNRQQAMKATAVSSASVPLMVFLSGVGVAGVIWVALQQDITPGVFSSYLASMIMTTKPIRSLSKINLVIQGGLAGAQTVFGTIDIEQEPDRGEVALSGVRREVKFDDVSFRYHGRGRGAPVLQGVSIDIPAGSTVALVGASGSGKSTIASLLLRFYSPASGRISIDGAPLESISLQSLRANTAIVTQEIVLFDDTIRRNIAYGDLGGIDDDKLRAAAAAANVTEFTARMGDGLDTVIGEQGVRLSGGQRQRIAIARALYKDAPLLIMDEATSSLDSHSERHIQSAIARLVRNRTSLIIAHRLSTIESADLILVLADGRVVERGAHAELLARGGAYARLHGAQHDDSDGARHEDGDGAQH